MKSQGNPDKRGVIRKEWPTFHLRPKWKIPKEWGDSKYESPMLWERVDADYFVPDNSASDRDLVFSYGLKYAANLHGEEEIACMYASAMSAFSPELEEAFLCSMKHRNIHPRRLIIPSQANSRGIVVNDHEKYSPDEALVLFGTGVHVLFKKLNMIEDVNVYNRFVRNSINALGRKLGMCDGVLSRLTFPLTLEKAQSVTRVFGLYTNLKGKIIRYLMSACKQEGNVSIVASHMCEVLAWSDLTAFASIKEMLHETKSPVLKDFSIQHEVSAFYLAMKKVNKTEHPQFFYYFGGGLKTTYLERNNFPVLAQVAEKLKSDQVRGYASKHFVAKRKESSPLVDRLVSLHRGVVLRKQNQVYF